MVFSAAADAQFEVEWMRHRHSVPAIRKFLVAMSVGARRSVNPLVGRFAQGELVTIRDGSRLILLWPCNRAVLAIPIGCILRRNNECQAPFREGQDGKPVG